MLETLRPVSKAIAATIAGAIVAFLMKHNIIIADGLSDAIEVILAAIITGAAVYFAPKNREARQ